MKSEKKLKICIIGAGIGGLTAAALLSKQGFKVKVFEKESLVGGRALTLNMSKYTYKDYIELLSRFKMFIPFSEPSIETIFKEKMLDGFHLDLGFHVFGGEIASNISNSTLDDSIEMLKSRLYVSDRGENTTFVTLSDKIKMLPNLLRLFLSGEKTMNQLDKISMTETIKRYGKGKMKDVLELNPRLITTVNNLDNISSGEVLRTQRKMKLRGVRYPRKGLENVFETLVNFIQQNGGKIFLNSTVSKVVINDNKIKEIVVNNKNISCDVLISNVIVQDLFKIVDERYFPKKYVSEIKSLRGTASLCAYYSLVNIDKDLPGKNFVFIEKDTGLDGNDVVGMVDFMVSLPEAGLVPDGHNLIQAYVICTPEEIRNKKSLEKLKNILDKNLDNIIPGYDNKLRWAIYPAISHLDGVAKTIENEKPDVTTPIDNLYLVGDCVKAPGIGFNCALNSANVLSDIIISKQINKNFN